MKGETYKKICFFLVGYNMYQRNIMIVFQLTLQTEFIEISEGYYIRLQRIKILQDSKIRVCVNDSISLGKRIRFV